MSVRGAVKENRGGWWRWWGGGWTAAGDPFSVLSPGYICAVLDYEHLTNVYFYMKTEKKITGAVLRF